MSTDARCDTPGAACRAAPACLCLALALALALGWCAPGAALDRDKRPPAPKKSHGLATPSKAGVAAPSVQPATAEPALQFIGTAAGGDGQTLYFLTDGKKLISAAQGELIPGDYRVDGILDGESLALTQVRTRQTIQLAPHIASDPPASSALAAPAAAAWASKEESPASQRPRRRRSDD